MNKEAVAEFLRTAEREGARRDLITQVLESVATTRSKVQELSLSEAYAAYQYEVQTFNRSAILLRLKQRMRARAAELVDTFLTKQGVD